MNRVEAILKYCDRKGFGLEIAPYFSPIAPKRQGFSVVVLDVFDTATLRSRALSDPFIAKNRIDDIEPVDVVGSATEILEHLRATGHLGKLDFIVSSHNFEHLPNPIKFLQGCYAALKPGGVLSMAVPDVRSCFDHFRAPTSLAEWLEAYFEDRKRPTPKQIFDGQFVRAHHYKENEDQPGLGCSLRNDKPDGFRAVEDLDRFYTEWQREIDHPSGTYTDCHCSTFFNYTLELMLRDLQYLKLLDFEILEITDPHYHEFFVHLKKGDAKPIAPDAFYARRQDLLMKINQSLGWSAFDRWHKTIPLIKRPPIRRFRSRKSTAARIAAEGARIKRRLQKYLKRC
jgi:predicted SAM-dependent methyltransferase